VTTGKAVFRTDVLYALPVSPDNFRNVLFGPVPDYFVREVLYVKGLEDACGVEYSYKDTQVPVNFVAGPYAKAASIQVVHQQAINSNPDFYGAATNAYEASSNLRSMRSMWRNRDGEEKPRRTVRRKRGNPPPPPSPTP
jgi:hypothetical protein